MSSSLSISNRIVYDMPAEEYHDHPAIGRSGLEDIAVNPKVYWNKHLNPLAKKQETTKPLAFGRAFHSFILEPEVFNGTYVILPEDAPRKPTKAQLKAKNPSSATLEQIDWWQNYNRENENNIVMTKSDHEELVKMAIQASLHPGAKSLLTKSGKPEVTVFWEDPETGVECKARYDWLCDDGIIVDVKSCRSANPDKDADDNFVKDAYNHGYTMQAAWYMEGYRRAFGKEPLAFVFIPVEKTEPYCVSSVMADELFLEIGNLKYRRNLNIYANCKKTGIWPGYPDTIVPLSVPAWVERQYNYQQGAY